MHTRQRDVLEIIKKYRAKNGESPTYSEIADAMGVTKTAVAEHVKGLLEAGLLIRTDGRSRNIVPNEQALVSRTDVLSVLDRRLSGPTLEKVKSDIKALPGRN